MLLIFIRYAAVHDIFATPLLAFDARCRIFFAAIRRHYFTPRHYVSPAIIIFHYAAMLLILMLRRRAIFAYDSDMLLIRFAP